MVVIRKDALNLGLHFEQRMFYLHSKNNILFETIFTVCVSMPFKTLNLKQKKIHIFSKNLSYGKVNCINHLGSMFKTRQFDEVPAFTQVTVLNNLHMERSKTAQKSDGWGRSRKTKSCSSDNDVMDNGCIKKHKMRQFLIY
jgi:hypothetical protein